MSGPATVGPATGGPATVDAEAVVVERLRTVRGVLGVEKLSTEPPTATDVLVDVVEEVGRRGDAAAAWLLIVGMTGAFPGAALVRAAQRAIALKDAEDATVWLLDAVGPLAMRHGNMEARLRVVTDRPLVDVHFTAQTDFLTGIQRVVRGVVKQWSRRHDVEFVVWAERASSYRSLHRAELARLLEEEVGKDAEVDRAQRKADYEIVVPWGVPVVLTEVPPPSISDRLAAVAELTDVSLRLVGYDCIPVSSAETVPLAEPEKFGRYLELVKFSDRLAGISRSAASEFEGFKRALAAQGLDGPRISACQLPHVVPVPGVVDDVEVDGRPVVVCVGSVGRRKNQAALLEAAEVLWREGLDFELRLLGHLGAERSPVTGLVPELQQLGRPLVVESGVSDGRIVGTLERARCLVFPSLHEGFGLPVVEALSHGVPVITSDFGSLREVGEGQGALLVDPEDIEALAGAIRTVLTDDEVHARLVAEAAARPARTWTDYADELWEALLA